MVDTVLSVQDVSKRFGRYQVLNHLSLTVHRGDIYALIGENGAGKTTLMRLICGLSPLRQGAIMLLGEDARHYRMALRRTGAIIESPAAYSKLTVTQNLHLTAIQHGLSDYQEIGRAIAFVGLTEKRKTKAGHLSLGQKQRLGLATAILAHPDFLVLDEPINGLDPTGIVEFRQLLHRLNAEFGTTILISSHILGELYQVATVFGFLKNGTIIKELSKQALDQENAGGLRLVVDSVEGAAELLDVQGIKQFTVINDHEISVAPGQIEAPALNAMLVKAGIAVTSITQQSRSLEEYFTQLIKKGGGCA
ncbi:ABC transporter ATP-binding protein [Lacticaseibacillus thailandensis]|uniref:ABC-type multidrug transport system, ATPase component n=1 Tax=Lacticaseibacillus thailandensis DSM 22698 = JCM 13996 TaxID=1423810 RepID=A0A0R2C9M0_9LACO|nr:ABC transporter ATP-binding protein [Lacticaseibacillus thailandensis]KRM88064.1 ABC-type multidrug transport system, ATPase component [Lacticaseibacillus thailandensis DSM 22698 = JCM 13996]